MEKTNQDKRVDKPKKGEPTEGNDVKSEPTVDSHKPKERQEKPLNVEDLRIAMRRLAARALSTAEFEILSQSFPRVFRE